VKTRVIRITRQMPEWDAVSAAALVIQRGGIVALPTDTTYGFAASVWCEQAIRRLREIKARSSQQGFVVIAADTDSVYEMVTGLTAAHRNLMDAYWPGPLTIVFEASQAVPGYLVGKSRTIAVRVPDDVLTQSILRACGAPLAAPSANLKGASPAASAREVLRQFGAKVDLVLDGGPVDNLLPSTIVAVRGRGFEILRRGRLALGEAAS
jgi:L-threonylcarbamoyladenylate synthase